MFALELKKIKRTYMILTMILLSIFGGLFVILNFYFRSKTILSNNAAPMENLILQNWSMVSMLNVMAIITGACILYNIEYSNNAMLKLSSLPIKTNCIFAAKMMLIIFIYVCMMAIETAAFIYCGITYLPKGEFALLKLMRFWAYAFVLALPVCTLMLFVSSLCKNMWITVGIGMIGIMSGVLTAQGSSVFNILPFSILNEPIIVHKISPNLNISMAAIGETILILLIQFVVSNLRRKNS